MAPFFLIHSLQPTRLQLTKSPKHPLPTNKSQPVNLQFNSINHKINTQFTTTHPSPRLHHPTNQQPTTTHPNRNQAVAFPNNPKQLTCKTENQNTQVAVNSSARPRRSTIRPPSPLLQKKKRRSGRVGKRRNGPRKKMKKQKREQGYKLLPTPHLCRRPSRAQPPSPDFSSPRPKPRPTLHLCRHRPSVDAISNQPCPSTLMVRNKKQEENGKNEKQKKKPSHLSTPVLTRSTSLIPTRRRRSFSAAPHSRFHHRPRQSLAHCQETKEKWRRSEMRRKKKLRWRYVRGERSREN